MWSLTEALGPRCSKPRPVASDMIGDLLASVLGGLLAPDANGLLEWIRDRRLLRADKARCEIHALSGRVLDIGTEPSAGTCTVRPGLILFSPEFGIVGDREIPVLAISRVPTSVWRLGRSRFTEFHVMTTDGVLVWHLSEYAAPAFVTRLGFPQPSMSE